MRQPVLLLLVAITVFFANLGGAALWDEDEPRNAGCAYEMLNRGDWIVPTFNDELRTHKPIFLYWGMLIAYHLLGVSEFSARAVSAVMAVLSVLATYGIGRRLFGKEVAFWSAIVLASCLLFAVLGRAATPDACLIAATTLAMLAFVSGVAARNGGRFPAHGAPLSAYRLGWRHAVALYAALGWGVLAKGPVGCVLPLASLISFLVLIDRAATGASGSATPWWHTLLSVLMPARWLRAAWTLRPLTGLLILAAVALPWYAAVAWRTEGGWVSGFLGEHNVGRFLHARENHSGPIVYYVPAILFGMFPWSVFLPAAVHRTWQSVRETPELRPQLAMCGCWAGVWVACFSLAATKLPNYVVPAYPLLAILIGRYLVDWRRADAGSRLRWMRLSLATLGTIGVTLASVMALIGGLLNAGDGPLGWLRDKIPARALLALWPLEREWPLGLVGLVLVAGAGWAFWSLQRGARERVLWGVGVASVSFVVLALGVAAPRMSRHQDGPWLAAQVGRLRGDDAPLGAYEFFASTLVYYNREPVQRLASAEATAGFLEAPTAMLVTRSDRLEQIQSQLPADVIVLARKSRFFRSHDVVLLGRDLREARVWAPSTRQ